MSAWSAHLLIFGIPQTEASRHLRRTVCGSHFRAKSTVFPSDPSCSFRLTEAKDDPRETAISGGLDHRRLGLP
jgi:hypothetical protein